MIYLSVSKLSTYSDCPEKYRLRHEEFIAPIHAPIEMIAGRVFHETFEQILKNNFIGDFISMFDQNFSESLEADNVSVSLEDVDAYLDFGNWAIKEFLRNPLINTPQVVGREKRFKTGIINVDTSRLYEDVVLTGRMDTVEMYEDTMIITDFKFGSLLSSADASWQIKLSWQALGYAYYYWYNHDILPDIRIYGFVKGYKEIPHRVSVIRTDLEESDIYRFLYNTGIVIEQIKRKKFLMQMGITCKRCEYFPLCTEDPTIDPIEVFRGD